MEDFFEGKCFKVVLYDGVGFLILQTCTIIELVVLYKEWVNKDEYLYKLMF